jgi:uncharacterized protein DUF5678
MRGSAVPKGAQSVAKLNLPEPIRRKISKPSPPDAEARHEYSSDDDGSFAWAAMNGPALYERYPEQWILVDKAKVIGSAKDPEELILLARRRGISMPFITKTAPPEIPAKAVYSGQVF